MSYSIYHQIKRQPNLQSTVQDIFLNWDATKIIYISLVFILMILNWTVEGIKWRLLLKGTEQLSIIRSLQSVLTGVAVSMITPNRIGEYMGRILFLENRNKIQGVT
ncbi:MAG TPA: lysylphosphatidylglycerol synthase domain-containing protein, partial [Chitinophagaceae bacterium]|nr:lysylphosphatidylglycerol synthase domain-containing protein [Chitinophagaceae bacterium]